MNVLNSGWLTATMFTPMACESDESDWDTRPCTVAPKAAMLPIVMRNVAPSCVCVSSTLLSGMLSTVAMLWRMTSIIDAPGDGDGSGDGAGPSCCDDDGSGDGEAPTWP